MVGRLGTVSILRSLDFFPEHRWSWSPSLGLWAGTVSAWVLMAVVGDTPLGWLRVGDEEVQRSWETVCKVARLSRGRG